LAHHALMSASDYPRGWQDQGSNTGTYGASFFNGLPRSEIRQLASCVGFRPIGIDTNPVDVAGDEFDAPSGGPAVTDTIDVIPTTAAAAVDASTPRAPKSPSCLQVQLVGGHWAQDQAKWYFTRNTLAGAKVTAGPLTVAQRPLPALGRHDVDLELAFPYANGPGSGVLYTDELFLRQGRVESNFNVVSQNAPPSTSLLGSLVTKAHLRLDQ
jgi:hypothetical protein